MWTKQNIPDQSGRTAIVTGANTGIGYETALALFQAGARVIIAARDSRKAEAAAQRMHASAGSGTLETTVLNLDSLQDIHQFAKTFLSKHHRLDLLVNNAGVMLCPPGKTADGYELHFGINFLGHFALTGYLYPALKQTAGARVVTVTSGANTFVDAIDFNNLKLEKPYDANRAYAISKLANLQFTFELQRRLTRVGDNVISVAAHPGVVRTELQRHIAKDELETAFARFKQVMDPWQGALPTLFAATEPTVKGAGYYGPDGEHEHHGYPALSHLLKEAAKDTEQGKQLWEYAEQATGIIFPA